MSTDENQFKRVQWTDDEYQMSDDDGPDGMPLRPPGVGLSAEDLELLTLAARALGATVEPVEGEWWVNLHFADGQVVYGWNPLMINGDAFELQVRMRMSVEVAERAVIAWFRPASGARMIDCTEETEPDPTAATRRAVTRAAAEIGKAMA